MKTRRQFLCVAWLAVCALLLLSACRGPTPIASRVDDTATPAARPETPTSPATSTLAPPTPDTPTPTGTPFPPTETPPSLPPPPKTPTPTPTDTVTPIPLPTETSTPTPTPELTAPVIEGYTLKQNPSTGRWEYYRGKKLVAYTTTFHLADKPVYFSEKPAELKTTNAVVVTDAKLMEQLIREGNTKAEVDSGRFKIPLPFDPTGVEMRLSQQNSDLTAIALTIPPELLSKFVFVQPFPGSVVTIANNYKDSQGISVVFPKELDLSPSDWQNVFFAIRYQKGKRNPKIALNLDQNMSYGTKIVTNLSGQMPPRFHLGNATAGLAIGSYKGGRSLGMENLLTHGSFLVAAAAPAS